MSTETAAKAWEDRVVLLEKAAADAAARETAMTAELAKAKADAVALGAVVEQAKAAEKARKDREVACYMADLQAKAAPNAISEPDMKKVAALFERGDEENARFMGGLLLKSAQAGKSPAGTIVSASQSGDTERAKANTAYQAEQLRAAGFVVEVSSDGTQITKKTPPASRVGGR